MIIGKEIITMYGKRIGKGTTLKDKVQEAGFPEVGERLVAGNLSKRIIIIDNGVCSFSFSPKGQIIFSANSAGSVRANLLSLSAPAPKSLCLPC